jgi:phage/plasmid-like protein (TIGR03299 family)
MSHYFESGFCVRKPSWHGLEHLADRYPANWDEAREWAGLTWEPATEPMFTRRLTDEELESGIMRIMADYPAAEQAKRLYALFGDALTEVEGFQRVYRDDDYSATLATLTSSYKPITHAEFGEIMSAVLEQDNVRYETAGSVMGGKQTWALALLDEPVTIPGDDTLTLPYALLSAKHNGKGAARLQSTSVRVVCANTYGAAETQADANGTVFAFNHTGDWRDRIDQARAAIKGVRDQFAAYQEWAAEMMAIKVTPAQAERFIIEFTAPPGYVTDAMLSDRVVGNLEKTREVVRGILAGPTCAGGAGTGYALVMAAGEYLDHVRGTRDSESHFRRTLLDPNPLKLKAVEMVRALA